MKRLLVCALVALSLMSVLAFGYWRGHGWGGRGWGGGWGRGRWWGGPRFGLSVGVPVGGYYRRGYRYRKDCKNPDFVRYCEDNPSDPDCIYCYGRP